MKKIKSYEGSFSGVNADLYEGGILFVKGTWGKKDIKQDLKFLPTIRKKYKMHKGGYEQAQELLALTKSDSINKVYAHSLGCAAGAILALNRHIPAYLYGGFRPFVFWQKFKNPPQIINYIYHTDMVPRIFFWRKYCGKVKRIKGKGFRPFTDHLRYQDLKPFFGSIKEEL